MPLDLIIVFALVVVAVVLFAWERVSFDVTALLILAVLLVTGIITPAEGLAGFSNAATITIGAMFVLSEGLRRTGVLDIVGAQFTRLGQQRYRLAIIVMMVTVGLLSGFINNTAAVAIFIPVVLSVAAELNVSASKLLMPVSFASMFGGVCTLIGTSTNILVSSIAQERGIEPFSMFEFAPLGLVFFVAGFAYLLTVGIRLIPERRQDDDLTEDYEMNAYLTDVALDPDSPYVGQPLDETPLTKDLDLDVLEVFRQGADESGQGRHAVLKANDVLRVRGSVREINRLLDREHVTLQPTRTWEDLDLERGQDVLAEAVVAPDSALQGKPIREVNFPERFGAVVLALRHRGSVEQEDLGSFRLSGGDSLLLSVPEDRVPEVQRDRSFVLVSLVGLPRYRRARMPLAVGILVLVVATAALGFVPIVVSAVAGCVALVMTGCLTTEEAYEAINWKVLFLIAGVLSLGTAMETTGAAELLAESAIDLLGPWGPRAVLSGVFFLSMMLTNVISNQATAALLAPIAIQVADAMGIEARPLLLAVTYAASLSFMTPVGYQTNTLIYGPGQYRFTDFTKVGTPLNLIFWILATLLIPVVWPF